MSTFITSGEWLEFVRMCFEIGILAFVIYKILYFVRGTRGSSVLAGIVVLTIVLSLLAKFLGFSVITWLLDGFWAVIGLAVVVIFQPELRRAFAQLGTLSIWQGRKRREVVSEIVQAVQDMARRKCGALIVLEKRIGLQNYVDDAIKQDIKVHAAILESIFYPNSPLHDGAIIIRDDRIVAARAILPLTRSKEISPNLGTRHRAALGISEESDAVTIMISEESGGVCIAYDGELHRDLSEFGLNRMLETLVVGKNAHELDETIELVSAQEENGELSNIDTEEK